MAPPVPLKSHAEMIEALVGTWVWIDKSTGVSKSNQLTLNADGTYVYGSSMEPHELSATGEWYYADGWLQFKTEWASELDPASDPVVGPIQILEMGPDFVRTPAGLVLRAA